MREAFKHAKAIAASGEGADFLSVAGIAGTTKVAGVSSTASDATAGLAAEFLADISAHRHWGRPGMDSVAA